MTKWQSIFLSMMILLIIKPQLPLDIAPSLNALLQFPLGPFQFFSPIQALELIPMIDVLKVIAACLLVARVYPTVSGWIFTTLFCFQSAILFSSGKIDHDLILIAPVAALALTGFVDSSVATAKRYTLLALVFYFSSSGLIKGLTGWLDISTPSAISALYQNYQTIYLLPKSAWESYILSPVPAKFLDIGTVLFEASAVFLLFWPRFVGPYLLVAIGFHLGILNVFGIDFTKLVVVYTFFFVYSDNELRSPVPPPSPLSRFTCAGVLLALYLFKSQGGLEIRFFSTYEFSIAMLAFLALLYLSSLYYFKQIDPPSVDDRPQPMKAALRILPPTMVWTAWKLANKARRLSP